MDFRFASNAERLQSIDMRELLKQSHGDDVISFAGGRPPKELIPPEAVKEAAERALAEESEPLQDDLTEGYLPLREQIGERMAKKGMRADPDRILLTAGSRQTIGLIVRVLTKPGDIVLAENPTGLSGLRAFRLNGLRVVPVESDRDGMDLADAGRKIREYRPRFVYVAPTFGNPTGKAWSAERRKGLLELCRSSGVAIVEDDPYGDIQFKTDETYPTLSSLAGRPDGSGVLYMSTFAKTIAPAPSIGWTLGDRDVIRKMAEAKRAADSDSGWVDQRILERLLRHFPLDDHIRGIVEAYGRRMERIQSLLRAHSHGEIRWLEPKGGMFLWLELPEGLDAGALLRCSLAKGVEFDPGAAFFAEEPRRNTARLNFACADGERMAQGIARFAEALSEFTARG